MANLLFNNMKLVAAFSVFCVFLPTSLLVQGLAQVPAVLQPAVPSEAPGTGESTGTIQRLTKQYILASIAPKAAEHRQRFLSSPSNKYVGYLVRSETAPGAGGFGNDFCYVQVKDTSTGASVWESDCSPVSTSNVCSLVFTDSGLEVFDGSQSTWNTNANSQYLETLELVDEGDMRIRTRDGDLAWKASDQPQANQQCGELGSPGLSSGLPPFAAPIEGNGNLPFGQPSNQGSQQQLPADGTLSNQQPVSGSVQPAVANDGGKLPLVDNTPFDSGCTTASQSWSVTALALVLPLVAAYTY